MKSVTIKDVAKEAGVSYSTVSRALSGSLEIKQETRERILKVCKELNYTANTVAKSMVMKSTRLIGLIMPGVNNPFMAELAYHIDRQASKRNYNIILCNSAGDLEQELEIFKLMLGRQVDGIILCPCSADSYKTLQPFLTSIPTVFLGDNLRDAPESYVSVDNYKGTYSGVEYLYELGHRDIVYFGRRRGSHTHQQRGEGYQAACRDLGITPQFFDNTFSSTSIKNGYEMAMQLFSQKKKFTAIFASTDTNALGVLQAAEELGIRIPEDVSLLGFDNIRDSGLPRIGLTTVGQPIKLLASISVECLLDQIENELAGYSHRIVSPQFVERSSCKKVK